MHNLFASVFSLLGNFALETASMKILIVSYPFAPNSAVGAKRMSALADQFSKNYISCDILTIKCKYMDGFDPSIPTSFNSISRTSVFLPNLPITGTKLCHRISRRISSSLRHAVFRYDAWEGWKYHAIREGKRLTLLNKYNAILVSGPPFSSFLVAEAISDFSGIPLLLDYRDPWTAFDWTRSISKHSKAAELRIVKKAKGIVFCTNRIRSSFFKTFPWFPYQKAKVITNGYFPISAKSVKPTDDSICLSHSGTLYGERTLTMLIEPLRHLTDMLSLPTLIHHWGRTSEKELSCFKSAGLENQFCLHSRVHHSTLMGYLQGSDVLVAHSGTDVNYALPYKVFDYLATGRPILALTPKDSELADFVNLHKLGYIASPDDPSSIITALLNCIESDISVPPPEFCWTSIAHSYIEFLERLIGRTS